MRTTSILRRIHFYTLLGFVFTLTFNPSLYFTNAKLNNFFFILFATSVVLNVMAKVEPLQRPFNNSLLLLIMPYLAFLFSLSFTDNFQSALKDLTETKTGILVFPFLIFFSRRFNDKEVKIVLLTFVISCLCVAVYCIMVASYRFHIGEARPFMTYHELSLLAGMHAVYLAMFYLFSIIILIYLSEDFYGSVRLKVVLYCSIAIFIVSIFLLAARTHIFLLILAAIGYFAYRFYKRTSLFQALLRASLLGLFLIFLVFLFPQNRERFKQLINYKGEYHINSKWGEQQMRPLVWRCALQLIAQNPAFGLGIGDVQDALHQCYVQNEFTSLTYFEKAGVRFNAHNQYLEMTLAAGVLGLIIFLLTLFIPLFKSFKFQHRLYLFFILLFALSCMTESFLERYNGVAFYSFFNSFLYFGRSESYALK